VAEAIGLKSVFLNKEKEPPCPKIFRQGVHPFLSADSFPPLFPPSQAARMVKKKCNLYVICG